MLEKCRGWAISSPLHLKHRDYSLLRPLLLKWKKNCSVIFIIFRISFVNIDAICFSKTSISEDVTPKRRNLLMVGFSIDTLSVLVWYVHRSFVGWSKRCSSCYIFLSIRYLCRTSSFDSLTCHLLDTGPVLLRSTNIFLPKQNGGRLKVYFF